MWWHGALVCRTTGLVTVNEGTYSTLIFDTLAHSLRERRPCALATIITGRGVRSKLLVAAGAKALGSLGNTEIDRIIERDALGELAAGSSSVRHYGSNGEAGEQDIQVFIETFAPPPRMIIFGAVGFTAALSRAAKLLGYRVTICDARATFATSARFPEADEVVNEWPDRFLLALTDELRPQDAICVLTHDHKFDIPAIAAALETQVGYIGAMGSRRTHEERVKLLREAGVADPALARVMAPIGLDIGSRTPEETAIAICAEIIAVRAGRNSIQSLRDSSGPIHI